MNVHAHGQQRSKSYWDHKGQNPYSDQGWTPHGLRARQWQLRDQSGGIAPCLSITATSRERYRTQQSREYRTSCLGRGLKSSFRWRRDLPDIEGWHWTINCGPSERMTLLKKEHSTRQQMSGSNWQSTLRRWNGKEPIFHRFRTTMLPESSALIRVHLLPREHFLDGSLCVAKPERWFLSLILLFLISEA